jgi:hypothetical protein
MARVMPADITPEQIDGLRAQLHPLVGVQFELLKIPRAVLVGFEPSQIGTIVGTLMDACIPQLAQILPGNASLTSLGIKKHPGILLNREGYPDYLHEPTGSRLELKLLYVDPVDVDMKVVQTRREPSARITQKVTVKNVDPSLDALLVLAYQLKPTASDPDLFSPTIIDIGCFSMIESVRARDHRLIEAGGKWFGDYETPTIVSKAGKLAKKLGQVLEETFYGRKESEGRHFNEDTNFGKLKRIPYRPLQEFLKKHNASYARTGTYPEPWVIATEPGQDLLYGGPEFVEDDDDD